MNVGQTFPFIVSGAPMDGGGSTFVWKWWDGTVNATTAPVFEKTLNMGGRLILNVIQCDQFGNNITFTGSITVNFPPVVVGSPQISSNNQAFPFSSVLQSTSYDPDHPGGVELSFAWYNGGTFISAGTTTVVSTGTYLNKLEVDNISENETLTQVITDTQNGVTKINYALRGFDPGSPIGSTSSISNSLVSSANNLSEIVIGPGGQATFTSSAQDSSAGQLQFSWLAGTVNGWSSNFQSTDDPVQQANGLYQSQITLDVSKETPGVKTVFCTVTNLKTEQSIVLDSSVNLIAAQAPVINSISTDAPLINGGYAVSQAGFVHFSASASDPNNALLSYQWVFTQPSVTLYGRTVMLRPSDYSVFSEATLVGSGSNAGTGPLPITGQVTVSDRFGQSSTVTLNQFLTALVWPFTQVAAETSGTGSTSLQKRYWGVSTDPAITVDDLAGFNTDFSGQRNQSDAFTPITQYLYIVYPNSFGSATITVNGTIATDWLLTVATFNSISYNVYRSSVPLTGAYQVVIS